MLKLKSQDSAIILAGRLSAIHRYSKEIIKFYREYPLSKTILTQFPDKNWKYVNDPMEDDPTMGNFRCFERMLDGFLSLILRALKINSDLRFSNYISWWNKSLIGFIHTFNPNLFVILERTKSIPEEYLKESYDSYYDYRDIYEIAVKYNSIKVEPAMAIKQALADYDNGSKLDNSDISFWGTADYLIAYDPKLGIFRDHEITRRHSIEPKPKDEGERQIMMENHVNIVKIEGSSRQFIILCNRDENGILTLSEYSIL